MNSTFKIVLRFLPPLLIATAWAADRAEVLPHCALQPVGERQVAVHRVIDGDTFVDDCGRHIRVLRIDTPEMDDPRGLTAAAWVRDWFRDVTGPVTLDICDEEPTDKYDRVLADVRRSDGANLAESLLAAGQAWTLAIPPCGIEHAIHDWSIMRAAQESATGIWSAALPVHSIRELPTDQPYVRIRDQIREVRKSRRNITLVIGGRRQNIHVLVPRRSWPRFENAGIDLTSLRRRTLEIEGKVHRRPGAPARMYLDFPEFIELSD